MRISDWSSYVCSSYLANSRAPCHRAKALSKARAHLPYFLPGSSIVEHAFSQKILPLWTTEGQIAHSRRQVDQPSFDHVLCAGGRDQRDSRSEERRVGEVSVGKCSYRCERATIK